MNKDELSKKERFLNFAMISVGELLVFGALLMFIGGWALFVGGKLPFPYGTGHSIITEMAFMVLFLFWNILCWILAVIGSELMP